MFKIRPTNSSILLYKVVMKAFACNTGKGRRFKFVGVGVRIHHSAVPQYRTSDYITSSTVNEPCCQRCPAASVAALR